MYMFRRQDLYVIFDVTGPFLIRHVFAIKERMCMNRQILFADRHVTCTADRVNRLVLRLCVVLSLPFTGRISFAKSTGRDQSGKVQKIDDFEVNGVI